MFKTETILLLALDPGDVSDEMLNKVRNVGARLRTSSKRVFLDFPTCVDGFDPKLWVESPHGLGVKVLAQHVEPPAVKLAEPILQFFAWAHLPSKLQLVSKPFGELAQTICDTLPRNPERTVALRKLLESKDAAVRAALYKDE